MYDKFTSKSKLKFDILYAINTKSDKEIELKNLHILQIISDVFHCHLFILISIRKFACKKYVIIRHL